jgi:Na+/H+-dicarboxylate symporter
MTPPAAAELARCVLDMIRTAPNNTSDLAVATVVARRENEIDVEIFKSSRDV